MYTPCPCFSCGKQISYLIYGKSNEFILVEDAVEIDAYGAYGSSFDLSHMKIWICDECFKEKSDRAFVIREDVTEVFDGDDL